ncbi:MAG: hypothetical protein ACRCTA_04200 [Bacilli bacterium]
MIKILACFKYTPNLELLKHQDWVVHNNEIDTSYIKNYYAIYDEASLETALKLKERLLELNKEVQVDAISITNNFNEFINQGLYARGFDQVINLHGPNNMDCPLMLLNYLKQHSYDYIITGYSSNINEQTKFGASIASLLKWPCFINVTAFDIKEEHIKITSIIENFEIEQQLSTPAIIILKDIKETSLRVPTLKAKLETKNKQVIYHQSDNISKDKGLKLVDVKIIDKTRKATIIQPQSFDEFQAFYNEYLKELFQ